MCSHHFLENRKCYLYKYELISRPSWQLMLLASGVGKFSLGGPLELMKHIKVQDMSALKAC